MKDSDNEVDDKEFEANLERRRRKRKNKKRFAVSAEVYGIVNKKKKFVPKIIKKSDEQIQRIKRKITTSFLFSSLDKKDLDIVINAMEEEEYDNGEIVIQQGEIGDCLYIVEEGELSCSKIFAKGEKEKFLRKYGPGETFGELALLYNTPRAATIKAITDCLLWELDRETFNNIVRDSAQKKREKYEQFFKKVEILSTIDSYELMQISDAVKSISYKKNEYIIKEGDIGNIFYILEEGECVATKGVELGKPPVEIKKYSIGEYFGERALIKGEPRYANIISISDKTKVISLDRGSFKRLLGPIEPLLERNMEEYNKFVENK